MDKQFQPYVGPRPFERNDCGLFFGRDRETRDLKSLVTAHQVVLFYAQSGAGKTSLLNAGLLPVLEAEGFEVFPLARVRGLTSQYLQIESISNIYVFNTLLSWTENELDSKRLAQMSLAAFLNEREHRRDEDGTTFFRIIIFDQFEELFSFYPERWQEREGFFHQVAEALQADTLLRVLFVMREDFIANLDAYSDRLPERLRTRYRLERLRQEAARLAVEGPLRDTGRSFAEGVASNLVQQLLDIRVEGADGALMKTAGEYVEPVQLQVVCQSLWVNLPPEVKIITDAHIQTFGDVDQALQNFYERTIETAKQTGIDEKRLRQWFHNELITPAGTRGTVFRGREQTEGIPNSSIDALENQHIIRAEIRAGAHWYELTHDRLIEPIRKSNEIWFQQQHAEEQQQEIEQERQRARIEEQAKSAKIFRLLSIALLIMFLVAAVFAIYAFHQRGIAQKQAIISSARNLAAQAEWTKNQNADQLHLSVLLAVESMKTLPTIEGERTLRQGLELLPRHVASMIHCSIVSSVTFSPDGKYLATIASRNDTVRVFEATSGKELARLLHDGWVKSVSFSPDSKCLATGSDDSTARMWDVTSGKELVRMPHEDDVVSVIFSPDGKNLATASLDNTVHVWEAATGKVVAKMPHDSSLFSFFFNPRGSYLATVSGDNNARLWDTTSGKEIFRLHHDSLIYSFAFSPDGKYMATACEDNSARLWEATNGKAIARMIHDDAVISVAFSPDSKYLATASLDYTARLWDATSGKALARMPHDHNVVSVVFSPNSKLLATTGFWGKTAQVWDVTNAILVTRITHGYNITSTIFSPESKYLATTSQGDNAARVWNILDGNEVARMIHEGNVVDIAFSPDGKYLATASEDYSARLWELITGTTAAKITIDGGLSSVAFSPGGKYLAMSSENNITWIWETASGKKFAQIIHDSSVYHIALSPDGKYLATAGQKDNIIQLWETSTSKIIDKMFNFGDIVDIAFSPDGKYLATASMDYCARMWQASSGKFVAQMIHGYYHVESVAFSSDSKYLATTEWGRDTVRVWEANSGKPIAQMIHEGNVRLVAFSPDGRYLATTAHNDHTARIWLTNNGKPVAQMNHENYICSIAFSPDSKYLATSCDNVVQVWQAITGKPVRKMIHETYYNYAVFSPDGKYLLMASGTDKSVRVCEATSGETMAQIQHERELISVAFSPDGKYLVTVCRDNTARMWLWLPNDLLAEAYSKLHCNLTYKEWQQYLPDVPYRKTCPDLPIDPIFIETGRDLAIAGDIERAIDIFRRVKELEPSLNLDPAKEARRLAAKALAAKGEEFLEKSEIKKTIVYYKEALKLYPSVEISVDSWNSLGWYGCLYGYAKEIKFACERAVKLDPGNGAIRDTRGLARALIGDYKGAIEDFQFYLKWGRDRGNEESLRKRQAWIKELEAGRNPFDEATLKALRNE